MRCSARACSPTGVTPTTAAIHHLKWAAKPEATVVYSSGEARADSTSSDARRSPSAAGRAPEDVDFLEIGYPSPLLEERILLVDTPGVNDLSLQRADITYSYIPRADAVLFLLDAGQILKESERVFLEEKLLKGSRDKIVFVITKWDILSESERKEALAYARAKLAKLVKEPMVFPVSAETRARGRRDGERHAGAPRAPHALPRRGARAHPARQRARRRARGRRRCSARAWTRERRALAMKGDELDRRIELLEEDLAGQAGTIEQRRMKIREEVQGIRVGAQKDLDALRRRRDAAAAARHRRRRRRRSCKTVPARASSRTRSARGRRRSRRRSRPSLEDAGGEDDRAGARGRARHGEARRPAGHARRRR